MGERIYRREEGKYTHINKKKKENTNVGRLKGPRRRSNEATYFFVRHRFCIRAPTKLCRSKKTFSLSHGQSHKRQTSLFIARNSGSLAPCFHFSNFQTDNNRWKPSLEDMEMVELVEATFPYVTCSQHG